MVLYLVWLQEYDPYRHQYGSLGSAPKFATEQLASVIAGIAGFRYGTIRTPALILALAFIAVLAVQLVRRRRAAPGSPRSR